MYYANYMIPTTLVQFLAELAGRFEHYQMYALWIVILIDI
jgi:hypothetical protein